MQDKCTYRHYLNITQQHMAGCICQCGLGHQVQMITQI